MELELKPDFDEAAERLEAWWRGEIADRVPIKVTAPIGDVSLPLPDRQELERWWTDPELVVPRLQTQVEATYWGGEAVPVVFPVSISMVAVLAAYLGCPYRFTGTTTAWSEPVIEDWGDLPPLVFDRENEWWQKSAALIEAATRRAPGRFLIGLPDLNGPGEVLARLRGTEELLLDLADDPTPLKPALSRINEVWRQCHAACSDVIGAHVPGSIFWMGIWSGQPSSDLQCDFSCMISPAMFREFFLPAIAQQTEWVPRTIYHLDGPDALRHLDDLLSLPRLTGIQWVPGAGAPPMSDWLDVLKRILAAGKLLYVSCEPEEVEVLLRELPHRGLLLDTACGTPEEARGLVKLAARLSATASAR
jgi:hypothetical protein